MLAGVRLPSRRAEPATVTRRAVLCGSVAVAAAVLGGCTSAPPEPATSESPTAQPDADADAGVRESVALDEAAIIALYDAVISAHPGLADQLGPLREEHAAHLDSMAAPPPAAPPAPAIGSRPQAISALIDAEQRAVAARTAACEAAAGADLARVTALIAASEAGHAEFLRRVT